MRPCCSKILARRHSGALALAILLAALPKCPMCLAAYVVLGTGWSLSAMTASRLRTPIAAVCATALAWFAIALARECFHRARAGRRPANAIIKSDSQWRRTPQFEA